MNSKRGYKPMDGSFATKAIHTGHNPDDWSTRIIVPPIHAATAAKMNFPDKHRGFSYTRLNNPSRSVLEKCLASLDDAKYSLVFPSGVGALAAIYYILGKGDHVVSAEQIFPGYYGQMRQMEKIGISTSTVDTRNLENVRNAIKSNTKIVFVETPSNPFTWITDLPALSNLIKEINPNILLVVDNTVQTPYFQKPLELGADIVIYSLTKFINGHCDVMMGSVVTNSEELYNKLKHHQIYIGSVPSPFDCFLVHRSLATLELRMERHMKNALEVARFLEKHEFVEKVLYPGLESHPQHLLAKRLFSGTSGLMSFYLKGGLKETELFFESTRVIQYFQTLGGVETILNYGPILYSHHLSKEEMVEKGVSENFIRLSVGLENSHDIINDLDQALRKAFQV